MEKQKIIVVAYVPAKNKKLDSRRLIIQDIEKINHKDWIYYLPKE